MNPHSQLDARLPQQFDCLLLELRQAGLRVGVSEIVKCQTVLAQTPHLNGQDGLKKLRILLRLIIANNLAEQILFDQAFLRWALLFQDEFSALLTGPPLRSSQKTTRKRSLSVTSPLPLMPRQRLLGQQLIRAVKIAVALIFILLAITHVEVSQQHLGNPSSVPVDHPTIISPKQPTITPPKQPTITLPKQPTITPPKNTPFPYHYFILMGLALTGAALIWYRLKKQNLFPQAEGEAIGKGPPRIFLTPPPPQALGLLFLSPAEQEGLVWGIDHFLTEEDDQALDLTATVQATAKAGGLPVLAHLKRKQLREVWLWLDKSCDQPELTQLADNIQAVLRGHGLPVERAYFLGIPDQLTAEDGTIMTPLDLEERRAGALVAILTDGQEIIAAAETRQQQVNTRALLRLLSHWPRLWLVDFSDRPGRLAALSREFDLACILPAALATQLSQANQGITVDFNHKTASPDTVLWAAACALAPLPISLGQAHQLRQQVSHVLQLSPWDVINLQQQAKNRAGRLQWLAEERSQLVNHLENIEGHNQGQRLRNLALQFWLDAYKQEAQQQITRAGSESAWRLSPAGRQFRVEQALLRLWQTPEAAIRDLYSLFVSGLEKNITRQLNNLVSCCRTPLSTQIQLPWSLNQLPDPVQLMLMAMGFGGNQQRIKLRTPGRFWLGFSICLTMAGGMAIWGGSLWWLARTPPPYQDLQLCQPKEEVDRHGMHFVRLCPGSFQMGSENGDNNEQPVHQVTLSGFAINQYEVTNQEYRRYQPNHKPGEDALWPVTGVNWSQANAYCDSLGYRLPTEAEWEYAARAGSNRQWSFGNDETKLGEYAWYDKNSSNTIHPVGQKKPNGWQLYDMHGNAWEWVVDWYQASYDSAPQKNPEGPSEGEYRVLRGGAVLNPARVLQSAFRLRYRPMISYRNFGFRCVRGPLRQP